MLIKPEIDTLEQRERITNLKEALFAEERSASVKQVNIITSIYKTYRSLPRNIKHAVALYDSLKGIEIRIATDDLIVGNRTPSIRAGAVSPKPALRRAGKESEPLPMRRQDRYDIRQEDIKEFRRNILPFWRGKTLEDMLDVVLGEELSSIGMLSRTNPPDSSQGHISTNTAEWLKFGPAGLREMAFANEKASFDNADFYEGVAISLDGACIFMKRYADLARDMAVTADNPKELLEIARICDKLSGQPPETFHEAVQSVWFLYIILHMESNASSFSPGRMDQYLYPYYRGDLRAGRLTSADALELVQCLFLKFNQIVYMKSSPNNGFIAGFPICFNITVGGQDYTGSDAVNDLSYILLRAKELLLLPQPHLSAMLHNKSPEHFLTRYAQVVGKDDGTPQSSSDDAVVPAQ